VTKAPSIDNPGSRTYLYPPTGEQFTSVTTIISGTEDKSHVLMPWSSRITATVAVDNLDTLIEMLRRGAEGRTEAIKWLCSETAKLRSVKADAGSFIHDLVEKLSLWAASPDGHGDEIMLPVLPDELRLAQYDGDPLPDVVDMMTTGWMEFVSRWNPEILATEMTVFHPGLKVGGTLDAIFLLRNCAIENGRLVRRVGHDLVLLVDLKTGKHLGAGVYEQLAAYCHFPEALVGGYMVNLADELPPIGGAAVLHCRHDMYDDGYALRLIEPVHHVAAWNRFRRAEDLYHGRKPYDGRLAGRVVWLPRPDGTPEPARLCDLVLEGHRRAGNALIKAGLRTVEDVARFSAEDFLAVKGIGPKTVEAIRVLLASEGLHLTGEAPTTPTLEEVA
jgi:hypothetical protein